MRHSTLTVSVLAALLLSACAQEPQTDAVAAPISSESTAAASAETTPEAPLSLKNQTAPSPEASDSSAKTEILPALYRGLDAKEISRAEIDELVALKKANDEIYDAYQTEFSAWRSLDRATRGPRPKQAASPLSQEENARLEILNRKLKNAEIRKKYENYDSKILSATEVQEIIVLEQAQAKNLSDHQNKVAAWNKQDPATRGERPEMDMARVMGGDPRLMELQGKIQTAEEMKRLTERVEKLSEVHNISLSDSQISELTALEKQQRKAEIAFTQAMMEAEKAGALTGEELSETDVFSILPKHLIQEMLDVQLRIQSIKGPLEAAEKADQVQKRMAELSAQSGIPILSGELSETVALNAEKDRIKSQTQLEAIQKWLAEGGDISNGMPLPNDEDYARLKEIDARLKAIAAPMTAAKNAALEADNPALRQMRLDQEKREKWKTEWQDRKQAGDIPSDVPLTSPTFAEIQDRVENYGSKLKARADKVGYSVPDTDLERLDSLNAQMLAIRKTAYEAEANGSSRFSRENMHNMPSFKMEASMYKVKLIEREQREILAGLREAESYEGGGAESTSGKTQPTFGGFEVVTGQHSSGDAYGAESIIEKHRMFGIEISQSEADDLRAFEQALKGQ